MISTTEITPAAALKPFVRRYTYREFDTCGKNVTKPFHADHKVCIGFFFKSVPVKLTDPATGKTLIKGSRSGITGLCTQYAGEMNFHGEYAFLQIEFHPNGFHKIFSLPQEQISNRIILGEDFFERDHFILLEQLGETRSLRKMGELCDQWLFTHLKSRSAIEKNEAITATANLIIQQHGQLEIDELAKFAHMTHRTLERQFMLQVGCTPKQLCCITRFNRALQFKLDYPLMDWGNITQHAGYFDQAHLIRDFKRYCGDAPVSLLKHVPLFKETYYQRTD